MSPVAARPADVSRSVASSLARGHVGIRMVGVLQAALLVLLAGNLVRMPALSSGAREAPISLNDLAALLTIACGTAAILQARRLVVDGVARAALTFAAIGAGSAVLAIPRFGLSVNEVLFSLAYLARWLLYFGLYVVARNGLRRADALVVGATLQRVVLAFAAFGIVQSILLPGFAQLVYPDSAVFIDWDPQGRRLVSSFLDPNFAGAFIAIGFLLVLARLSCGVRGQAPRLWMLALALILTASRSSILAVLAGAVVVALGTGLSRRVLWAAVGLGAAFVAALPAVLAFGRTYGKLSIDASALQRVVAWLRALRILADHPIIGVGFNTYGFVQRTYDGAEAGRAAFTYSLDGGLLFIGVMTGAFGVVAYVAMLARANGAARAVWRSDSAGAEERALAIATAASTVAIVVHSAFVNSLLHPFLMEPLWMLWAAVAVIRRALPIAPASAIRG